MAKKPNKVREAGETGLNGPVVYQVKVSLKGILPRIWRRIQVTSDTLLWGLHGILQAVMGWNDEHSHRFLIKGAYYGDPGLSSSVLEVLDEESVRLSQVMSGEDAKFIYEYGSDKGWDHEVLIEKILSRENGQRYPICLEGERACPPDHCPGPRWYREFLKTLKDAARDGDKDRRGRVEEDFDPERFDQKSVNRRLGWS
jgi:hypothetical protein